MQQEEGKLRYYIYISYLIIAVASAVLILTLLTVAESHKTALSLHYVFVVSRSAAGERCLLLDAEVIKVQP